MMNIATYFLFHNELVTYSTVCTQHIKVYPMLNVHFMHHEKNNYTSEREKNQKGKMCFIILYRFPISEHTKNAVQTSLMIISGDI